MDGTDEPFGHRKATQAGPDVNTGRPAGGAPSLPPNRGHAGSQSSYFLLVDGEIVEVDWLTFDTLMIGEALRIRSTRDNKAINIDRLLP